MTNLYEFNNFKKTKIIKSELKNIIQLIDNFEVQLSIYTDYSRVQDILNNIQEHKRVIKESLSKLNNHGE